MPTLQQITCSIELSQSRTKLKEYGARYHNAAVEVFVAVPDEKVPFCVHISTEGYIAPGLAFFVFIDGERRLKIPGPGVDKKYYEIDTVLRQKEEKIKGGGFIGRDWVFNELKIANADTASPQNLNYIHNVGTIEVVVLRCKPDPPSPPRILRSPSAKPDAPAAISAHRHAPAPSPAKAPSAKATPAKARTATPAGTDAGLEGMFGLFDGANDVSDLPMSYDGANDLQDLSPSYDGANDPLDRARVNMILNARPTLNLAHPELSSPLNYYFDQYAGGGHRRGTSEPTVYTINTETTRPAEALCPPTSSRCSDSTEEIKQALYEANRNDAALQHVLSQPLPDLLDEPCSPQHSSRDQASDHLSPTENPQVDGDNGGYPQVHYHQPWHHQGRDDISGDRYFGLQGRERDLLRERFRQQGIPVSPVPAPKVAFSPQNEVFNLPFHPRREQNMKYYQKFKDPIYLNVDVLDLDPIAANDKGQPFHVDAHNYEDTLRHMNRIIDGLQADREVYMDQHDQTPPGRIRDAIMETIADMSARSDKYVRHVNKIIACRDAVMKGSTMRFTPKAKPDHHKSASSKETKASSQQHGEQQPQAHSAGDGWNQTGQGTVDGGQQLNQSWSPGPVSVAGSQRTEEHFDDANKTQCKASAQSGSSQSAQQHYAPVDRSNHADGQSQDRGAPNWQPTELSPPTVGWTKEADTKAGNDGGWNQHSSEGKPHDDGWGSSGEQQQSANQWSASQASNRSQSKKGLDSGWAMQGQSAGADDAWASSNDHRNSGAWDKGGDNPAAKSNAGSQKAAGGWGDDTKSNASHRSKQSGHASNKSAGGWNTAGPQQQNSGGDAWCGNHSGQDNSWGDNDASGGQKASSNKGWGNSSNVGSKTQTRDFAYAQDKGSPGSQSAHGPASQVGEPTSSTPIVKPYFADWQNLSSASHDTSDPDSVKKREAARPAYQYPAKEMPSIPASRTGDVSHGVQVGKGAKYTHETGRPEYIDSMTKPFAVFSFKYRSKGYLEKLLKRPVTTETESVDEAALKDKLLSLPRHKLVEELMMARGALPGHTAKDAPASLKSAMKKSSPASKKPASSGWGGAEQKSPSNGGWGGEQKAASTRGWVAEQKAASNAGWGGNAGVDVGGWDGADKKSSHSQSRDKSQHGSEKKDVEKRVGAEWTNTDATAAAGNSANSGHPNGWSNDAAAAQDGGWGSGSAKWDGAVEHKDLPATAFSGTAPPVGYVDGKEPSIATGYESPYTPERTSAIPQIPLAHTPWMASPHLAVGKAPSDAPGPETSYTPKQKAAIPLPNSSPWQLPANYEDDKAPNMATDYDRSYMPQHMGAIPSIAPGNTLQEAPADYVDGKEPSIATGFEGDDVSEEDGIPPPGCTPWKLRVFR
ncbi:hypothetical protein Tdes44962_MAKER07191 [Teratosphaeria destructans]|uniref:Uncharacterized protein n=1 Tax=Teratosphaeria destructans TaxID=418781 RepID=A0A9W7W6M2_9PEZI|nr:hypothetical protein Tdes44962_MAKER07191 [Teratosphaeria destructans]